MSIHELIALANYWLEQQQPQQAISHYLVWLQENTDSPYWSMACFNLGVLHVNAGHYTAAAIAYQQAFNAGSAEAGINLALLTEELGNYAEAVNIWQSLLDANQFNDPAQHCQILNNLGRLLEDLSRIEEAVAVYTQSLLLQAEQPPVIHRHLYLRQQLCLWPVDDGMAYMSRLMITRAQDINRFLALVDDEDRQSHVLEQWLNMSVQSDTRVVDDGHIHSHDRLRLGYLLSHTDHDQASWLNHIITAHDTNRYEYSVFVRHEDSEVHVSLNRQSDWEAAQVIRAHEIDILIDLDGLHRGVFDYRPATVQCCYPGLSCWVDHASVDYVLADPYIWSLSALRYTGKHRDFHYVSGRSLPDDPGNKPGERSIEARQACGLPGSGLIFCHVGEAYKITESMFSAWMEILIQVPDSVLWLVVNQISVHTSLRQAAANHGIDGNRLILASEIQSGQIGLADVFLDSYPSSAAAWGYAALAQAVPVVTCAGSSPVSRINSSYLSLLGLTELITATRNEYMEKAVQIGNDPERLAIIRAYLNTRLKYSGFLDMTLKVRTLEALFDQLWMESSGAVMVTDVQHNSPVDPKPFFSLIVVHYEGSVSRPEVVRCLQSLYFQKYRNFEILLLHDGPRTQTWETDEFPPPPDIRLKTLSTPQRANDYGHSLRDLGIRMARGKYLLITNADNYHYTDMLLQVYTEIIRPYPKVVIHDIDRTAADIIIFGILASGYMSLGTHENIIDFREFNMQMARQQWMYLSGYPSIVKNIDCMQFVMRRELWLKEGGWYIKVAQAADGLLYEVMVKKYGVRYVVGPLAEHL
ncbi:MAG: glycosyltransferase [Methylococcaceae bacterium]